MKLHLRYLNVLIPCQQFGIISKIVRIGHLLQNFKKAIIQRNNPDDVLGGEGRPCRAEIRWYGATDAGLRDIRSNVRHWGLECEIELHQALTMAEHEKKQLNPQYKMKTPTEISEIVLGKRLDVQKRKELYALDNRQNVGDDN